MKGKIKDVKWVGSSKKDICSLPDEVKSMLGYSIYEIEKGNNPRNSKILRSFNGDVRQIACNHDKDTYRAVYTVAIKDTLYILHVFKKKSKSGISLPKQDRDLIKRRLLQITTN